MYRDYDPFAWLFAHHWGQDYHRQVIPALERLILRLLPPDAAILDLCCGDGRIAAALAGRGFRVTGLDGSEQMLRYARQAAPDVRFVHADAREFSLAASFDAVISTFDSLNHVESSRELKAVFLNVFKALNSGGYFGFDLNREQAYIELWTEMTGTVADGAVSVAKSTYDARREVAACAITEFRKVNGEWQRSDYRLTQKHHPHDRVMAGLEAAGFQSIASFDAIDDLRMKGPTGQHRTFYLARK